MHNDYSQAKFKIRRCLIIKFDELVKSVLRLFDELVKCDEEGVLKGVREAAEGK